MHIIKFIVFSILATGVLFPAKGQQSVKIWEEPLVLPTYLVKAPDKNPMFFRNQSYQGASRVIYPYALEDNITNKKTDKTYKALYLENEYIKLCVLPEIGGRLFYATDKTNGYEMFYRQHVIKPANVGMVGAWISGGIEFCVFHHHRASTNIPVNYKLVKNEDGSATIWIGETEPRHRMKWTIGISLFPGKSYLEVDGRLMNPTENVNSILYWANVATHANDDYQIIFPPSTDFAVYHAKNSFAHWPVTKEVYNEKEYYKDELDASWWKNHPNPVSMFAHDIKDGFLAGYDHGKEAGTMHVANHHIAKGAKLWEWGPGLQGAKWDSEVLTDSDGPYAELMTGAYSDNQPDYSWLKPYEWKTFKQYWYPIRETEGAVAANLNAAINLKKVADNKYLVAVNTTQKYVNSKILVNRGSETLFESTINISPEKPYSHIIKTGIVKEGKLAIVVTDKNNNELISYKPVIKTTDKPLPDEVIPPEKPEEIESLEELYLTGQRIKQFHNARINPEAYFLEALKRDPFDVRSNTMMGIIAKEEFRLNDAANYFRTALKRLTANYTRPRDCEALYHLGLILQHQGKYEAAYDTLYRAAWDQSFASAAYFHLAQISCARMDYKKALTEIERSLYNNSANLSAMNLKISILRRVGYLESANKLITNVLEKDELSFFAINEKVLLEQESWDKLAELMQNNPEAYLELAIKYLNSGFTSEAKDILLKAVNSDNMALGNYPTIHYYLGYLYAKENNPKKSEQHFAKGSQISVDYCFPFRFESIKVFEHAIENKASDSRAHYYLGNLLYDKQAQKAIENWEKAVMLDSGFAIAYRNLGWGYSHSSGQLEKAIAAYEKAILCDKTDARYYHELDKLYEAKGTDINKRYQLLTENHEFVAQHPNALLQEIKVLMLIGKSKEAIELLTNTFFPKQEGIDNLHDIYVDACLSQGIFELTNENYSEALKYFLKATEYPENHQEAGDESYEKNVQIYFYQTIVYEKLKQSEYTKELLKKATSLKVETPEYMYYKAMLLKKKGDVKGVEDLMNKITRNGEELLASREEIDFFSKFGEMVSLKDRKANGNHLLGLAALISENPIKATEKFELAIKQNPNHLWAKIQLSLLKQ